MAAETSVGAPERGMVLLEFVANGDRIKQKLKKCRKNIGYSLCPLTMNRIHYDEKDNNLFPVMNYLLLVNVLKYRKPSRLPLEILKRSIISINMF